MISVAPGFQYSVNIGYDMNDAGKLKSFIPTKSSLSLLKDVLESTEETSTERARVLVGAYGKGKSHIVLTILSVLMGREWDSFALLKERAEADPELGRIVANYYESGKKLLPVIISGSSASLHQAFLSALHKTLAENDLMQAMPETNYQAAVRAIRRWEREFPETFEKFKDSISRPVDGFVSALEDYDIDAYAEFERLYPALTAGSAFNPFLGSDIAELYEGVAECIGQFGYAGIYVVYDEFSKFLEANIKDVSASDTKMLQDFAEKCNRSGRRQLHLMLISHKEISNYIDELPKQKVDGWRGVSERFKHVHLNNNFTQTYEIISSVIIKDQDKWDAFQREHDAAFEDLWRKYRAHSIFSDVSEEESRKIIRECYPLHPITTFILPRLSERVAQNERTLFTFLSAKGTSTLSAFLDEYKDDCFRVITPDMIFDYFEPLFRKESYASELHEHYILARTILEKVEEGSLEAKIVKSLSLIYILDQFDKLRPTKDEILGIYSLECGGDEIAGAIEALISKECVVYLKVSNGHLRLKQSSGVDIKQEIANAMERGAGTFSVKGTLNSASIDGYMYPSRYNDEHEMTRYFALRFIDGSEAGGDVDWGVKGESVVADGIFYGVIPDSEDSIPRLRESLLLTSGTCKRAIFALPRKYFPIEGVVMQFNAVMKLRSEAEGDDILFDEYEAVYEDLGEVISDYVRSFTRPEYYRSLYIHDGREVAIARKAGLTGLMSQICEDSFPRTPVINNEAINKSELTGTAYNSRNKVISGLLRNTLESNLGLSGTGQDMSIMRSALIRKNVLVPEPDGSMRVNTKTGDENMDYLLSVISAFIQRARHEGTSNFGELYGELTLPEGGIGIRKPLVLIYLAAMLHEFRQEAVITSESGQMPLSVETLLQIEADPSLFELRYLDWDPEKEQFIEELGAIFDGYIVKEEKERNAYDYVASAMRRWCMALPKYSKEAAQEAGSKECKGFIRLLRQNVGSYDLLFARLPREFGRETADASLADDVRAAKAFYDGRLGKLVEKLGADIRDIFKSSAERIPQEGASLASLIRDWCERQDPAVFDQLFENGADRCIRCLREVTNDEGEFVTRLARLITDLRIEDWDSGTEELFCRRLEEYKATAEGFKPGQDERIGEGTAAYSLTYIDGSGNSITRHFSRVEESARGKLLMNSVISDMEAMGYSVSEQEKRQVLMEVLKKLC